MHRNADIHFAALIFMVGAGGLASVLEVGVAEQTKAEELEEDDTENPAPTPWFSTPNPEFQTIASHV